MRRLETWVVILLCGALTVVPGCLIIDIFGDPAVRPGQTQQFQVKLTNPSACPVFDSGASSDDLAIVPLAPLSAIEAIEDEETRALVEVLCGLRPPPSDLPAMLGAVEASEGTLRSIAHAAALSAQMASCSGPGVSCGPLPPTPDTPPGGVLCALPALGAGEMVTLDCEAPVPSSAVGTLYTFAQTELRARGVCKAGSGQGNPCANSANCGIGGVCAFGICVDGTNDGNGCNAMAMPSECPGGQCIACSESTGVGAECQPFLVLAPAQAPAVGPWGLGVGLVVLAALAGYRLRAHRRRG
jgi:hypothetical protein